MSIFHTLKRKLRSCRRQQDGVLKTFNEELEQEIQKRLSFVVSDIHSLIESKVAWRASPTFAEIRAYEKLSLADKISLLNSMLARVHELRMWHVPIAKLPLHETQVGPQLWMSDLPKSDATRNPSRGVRKVSSLNSSVHIEQ
ncbi:hypothetical protein HKD24_00130 [Gluconobacter sp. LMG 31484]|uniref:Transposase n=1 Tax=Gluconobacter vitians TaxID=2728102 RepID=A0ABR9Y2E4_9PROT|nr:hypothetical protein [Gluconobacter vitians]MBF0857624.1 hypothetical protein [Gluconobacter vitians]